MTAKTCSTKVRSQSLYHILGVEASASASDIRAAYRRKALLAHPDKGGTKEEFQVIVHAFETLSSSLTRSAYDAKLSKQAASKGARCGQPKRRRHGCSADVSGVGKDFKEPSVEGDCQNACKTNQTAPSPARSNKLTTGKTASCRSQQDMHECSRKKHSKPCKASKHDRAMSWLHRAIQKVPREHRKMAVQGLPVRVGNALLKYVQMSSRKESSYPASESQCAMPNCLVRASCDSSETTDSDLCSDIASSEASNGIDVARSLEDDPTLQDDTQAQVPDSTSLEHVAAHTVKCASSSASGCRGVLKDRRGKASYQATVTFCNLCVITRCIASLEIAIEYHTVLVAFKQQVLDRRPKNCPPHSPELGPLIKDSLTSACAISGVSLEDLSLSFRVVVFAPPQFIGLRKVWGRFCVDLENVLQQRAQLLEARDGDWSQFRAAWVKLMQMPVSPRETSWGNALSKPKTEAEAAAIADAAWEGYSEGREHRSKHLLFLKSRREAQAEQSRLKHERRGLRRLRLLRKQEATLKYRLQQVERASSAVEHTLDIALERATAAARADSARLGFEAKKKDRENFQQEQLRRKHRWTWLRDPSRTVEELLRGPPV